MTVRAPSSECASGLGAEPDMERVRATWIALCGGQFCGVSSDNGEQRREGAWDAQSSCANRASKSDISGQSQTFCNLELCFNFRSLNMIKYDVISRFRFAGEKKKNIRFAIQRLIVDISRGIFGPWLFSKGLVRVMPARCEDRGIAWPGL
jgi:hypothetical protein